MADPFISSARQDFQDTKADLRSAYESGELTKQQFQEAKNQARDVFSGYKGDVRAGTVTDYSNPFANFSYTPSGGISNLAPEPTLATTNYLSRPEDPYPAPINNTGFAVLASPETYHRQIEPDNFDFTGGHTNAPQFNIQNYADVLSGNKLNKLNSLIDIISSGGTLSKSQEASLGKIGGLANLDVAAQLGYTPVSDKYNTKFSQFAPQAEGVASSLPIAQQALQSTTPAWVASPDDLYQYLKPQQETKLSKLADLYAAGELEGREDKLNKLEKLLEKGQLGTVESFFSPTQTYTAPTNLSATLPEGVTYQQLADYYYSSDPVDLIRGYTESSKAGITPEQYQQIVGGYQSSYYTPVATQYGIENFLSTGKTSSEDYAIARAYLINPNNPVFVNNPGLATRAQNAIYSFQNPIDKTIKAPEAPGQYGYYNNAPVLSAKVADNLLKGETFQGGNDYFGYGSSGKKDDALGWDLHSKYLGSIVNGVGIFGSKASSKDIPIFDKIDKQIQELGGVKTEVDENGNKIDVFYKEVTDPDTGQKRMQAVNVGSLFAGDEGGGEDKYRTYVQTKEAVLKGAEKLGIDPSKYDSFEDLYDEVNDKSKNLYVVTGRANNWDPDVAEAQGITGVGKDRGGVNHAQVLYQKVGDKLVPLETLKTFKFDDPNTTSGFFGDLAQGLGSILSAPPIQLAFAMAGGWPALFEGTLGTAAAGSAAANLATSIGTTLGFEGATADLVGKVLLNAGSSALSTGLATGDLEKAGIAALSGGIGAGVTGGLPMLVGDVAKDLNISQGALKIASEIAGGAAATAVTGQDPGQYAINRLLSTGIGALMSMGAEQAGIPTKGPGAELLKAMMPIITSKKVGPEDVVRLTKAVAAFESKQA